MVERGCVDSTLLKLKDVAMCGDPKMLANAMKFFHRGKNLTQEIVHWRAYNCLDPLKKSSTCNLMLIATHIDSTK